MKIRGTLYHFCLLLLLVVAGSCKDKNNDTIDITADLFGENILITTERTVQTRLAIQDANDKVQPTWQSGEPVTIFTKQGSFNYVASVQRDNATVVFTAMEGSAKVTGEEGDTIYAFIHNNQMDMNMKDGHITGSEVFGNLFTLNSTNARDMFLVACGVVKEGKVKLDFEHIYSYLKVTVTKESLRDYDYLCVYCYDRTLAPAAFDYNIKVRKFSDETVDNGYNFLFIDKDNLTEDRGGYYTTYVPIFPSSEGTSSYYVSGYKENEEFVAKAMMFVDDPEEGLKEGQMLKAHIHESFTKTTNKTMDGRFTVLEKATEGPGINLIFMGKGFADKDITSGKYTKMMVREMDRFFSVEPYKSLRKHFTSYCVYRVSDSNNIVDVANGEEFAEEDEWFACQKYAASCINLKNETEVFRVILVYNGNYVGRSFTQMNPNGDFVSCIMNNSPNLTSHEAGGHGFCFLGDEYVEFDGKPTYDDMKEIDDNHKEGRLVNVDYNKDNPRWKKFIDNPDYASENIGVYEGAYQYSEGIYRPTENSIMNDHYICNVFNAPCREAIYKAVMKFSNKTYSEEEFLWYDKLTNLMNSYNNARQRTTHRVPGKKHIKSLSPIIRENR